MRHIYTYYGKVPNEDTLKAPDALPSSVDVMQANRRDCDYASAGASCPTAARDADADGRPTDRHASDTSADLDGKPLGIVTQYE